MRRHPWISFGAWGWPRFFCGGGKVIGADSERATHARLRFADGTTLEDSIDEGVALFMTDGPVKMPVTVEILDRTGAMLTTYEAFGQTSLGVRRRLDPGDPNAWPGRRMYLPRAGGICALEPSSTT